ncbi:MAG: Ldh family oxidoreductase, partial [Polaromonas sp.]|uniref:Ldh family oxidoreductase n=1 Tax=Polaromonas sp. TaxID=1869339 RepID=UPI0027316108
MTVVAVNALSHFCRDTLIATGLSGEHAGQVTDCLVNADLWGVESHGVSRLPIYVERLRRSVVNAQPAMTVQGARATGTVLGDNGPGAVVGTHAMQEAIARAREFGCGVMLARQSNHYGVAGHYTRMALAHDCIGISGCNSPIGMAAWGAMEPTLGTNPFAVAVPAGRYGTFALDMSSSVVAKGKILVAQRKGDPIPLGWALDAQGKPTTNADDAWNGVVLPFAGAKGSGFALFIEILSGALAGAAM